jgi:hypothetical protein
LKVRWETGKGSKEGKTVGRRRKRERKKGVEKEKTKK